MVACILARISRGRLFLWGADTPFPQLCLGCRPWTDTRRRGWHMNASSEIAEARATALVVRATAKVVRAERGPLMFRLNRAADALDAMVALAMRCLERIEQLEQELRRLRAGAQ